MGFTALEIACCRGAMAAMLEIARRLSFFGGLFLKQSRLIGWLEVIASRLEAGLEI